MAASDEHLRRPDGRGRFAGGFGDDGISMQVAAGVRVPYAVEQDEDGVWCARSQVRQGVAGFGGGLTREAALDDLRGRPGRAAQRDRASSVTSRRTDYHDDPQAPRANSLVPSVNAAVINEAGDLLLIRRTDNGNWALPGGAIDLGESVAQAAVRETLEFPVKSTC
jgi:hypothetical protein